MSETNNLLKVIIIILVIVFLPGLVYAMGAFAIIVLIFGAILYLVASIGSHKKNVQTKQAREAYDRERTEYFKKIFQFPCKAVVKKASQNLLYDDNGDGVPVYKNVNSYVDFSYGEEILIESITVKNDESGEGLYGRIRDKGKTKWILLNSNVIIDADQSQVDTIVEDCLNKGIRQYDLHLDYFDKEIVSHAIDQIYPPIFLNNKYDRELINYWFKVIHYLGETTVVAPSEEIAFKLFQDKYPSVKIISIEKYQMVSSK